MRKLTWFSGGFAGMCLLLVLGVPAWCLCAALPLAVGWLWSRPGSRAEWEGVQGRDWRRHLLWQVCRRGLALAVGCGAGACWFALYYALVCTPAMACVGEQLISGTVISQLQPLDTGGYALTLRLDGGADLQLYAPDSWGQVEPGDHVQVKGRVDHAPFTYGEEVTFFTAKGVFLLGGCDQPPTVERPTIPPVAAWPTLAARALRSGMEGALDPVAAPLAAAVALGDKSGLSDGVYQDLLRAGVLHAAVVSGLHISFLVGVMAVCCRGNRRWTAAMLPGLVFYAFMAGATPSAFRAVWMQSAALASPWVGREGDSPSALALALLVLVVQNPYAVASVGLQLSFLSVSGILLVTGRIYERLTRRVREGRAKGWKRLMQWAWQGVSASVSASLGAMALTVPLCGYVFGQVSLVAPVVNILVLWAVTGLMICALGLGLLALCLPGPAAVLGQAASLLGRYVVWMVHRWGTVPHGVLDMDDPYHVIWLAGAYVLGGILLFGSVRLGCCALAGAGLLATLAVPVGLSAWTVARCDLVVAALDVGQGASTLLLGGEYTVLVDCGGSSSASAGDLAADYLAGVGRTRVDALLLTHLDEDHCNGVQRLLDRVEVGQVILPVSARQEAETMGLEGWLSLRDIPCQWVDEETQLAIGGLEIRIIPPLGRGTTNEEGLSAVCTVGEFDVLFTGDADDYVEHMMVKYFAIPNIELLMVGHHGAADSTGMELLGWARPELGIISVGADNSYGHPEAETLERLRRSGVEVHRTDQEGTVTVAVRGQLVGIW